MGTKPDSEMLEEARLFHEGIALFNRHEWFESHETWEDAWRMVSGPRKLFYQGLIQCAVTVEHVRRGNPRGVRSVWATAQTKFVDLPPIYMGLDIAKLLSDVERLIRPVLDLPESWFDPARPRGQNLPVRWPDAPAIKLRSDPFAPTGPHGGP